MNRKFSTMKKPILILSLLFIHYACLFSPTVQNGLNPTKSNTIPAWILGLTGRGSEVSPEQNQIFDLEATTSGYSLPDVPIKGVSTITLAEDDTFTNSEEQVLSLSLMGNDSPNVGTRAANPNSPNFSTTKGVINYGFAILPSDIGVSDFTAQVWVNGQLSDINFDTTGAKTTNKLVLNNGKNYVLINVNSGDRPIARSNVYRIDSSVPDSMIRTEITWNGVGDLDLHADDGNGGKHVFWTYKKYTSANHNIELDVDNTKTHGPENIRIFTAPAGTSYRFYINYFRGFRDLKANAKIYKGTSLLESKTILFSVSDINASSVFNDKSKLIGVYTVGEIPVVIAPSNLLYTSSSYLFTNGSTITTQIPTFAGSLTNCVANPSLPTGLSINSTNCAISGTPTVNQAATSYTITASNSGGSTTTTISIAINNAAPTNLVYPSSSYTFINGTALSAQVPAVTGTIASCTITPTLPTGLSIDATTCAISGTPTSDQAATSYTITASNSGGNATSTISITINEIPPANLVYTGSPYTFTNGTAIITQTPTVTGTITNCTANPSLPTGLSINATTCAISGTPTATQAATSYTITASNSGGNVTATISIVVSAAPNCVAGPVSNKISYVVVDTSTTPYTYKVIVSNVDGSSACTVYIVSTTGSSINFVKFSPDNTKLLLLHQSTGPAYYISIINVDGTGFQTLRTSSTFPNWAYGAWAEWFDNNSYLYSENGHIYKSNVDGTNNAIFINYTSIAITSGSDGIGAMVRSPDGTSIMFMNHGPGNTYHYLYKINSDGVTGFTDLNIYSYNNIFYYSPDSSKITYAAYSGTWQNYYANANGTSQTNINTNFASVTILGWYDNTALFYFNNTTKVLGRKNYDGTGNVNLFTAGTTEQILNLDYTLSATTTSWDNTSRPRITTWDASSYTTSWGALASAVSYNIYYWTTAWNLEQNTTATSRTFTTNANSARKICAVNSSSAEFQCLVVFPVLKAGYPDLPSREITGSYFDDFSDGTIGSAFAQNRPEQISETSGYLQLSQNVTDAGPSVAINYNRGANRYMRIQWKHFGHRNGNYFSAGLSIVEFTHGLQILRYGMWYYDFNNPPNDIPCYGWCMNKDGYSDSFIYSRIPNTNLSPTQSFDTWLNAEVVIDFEAGTIAPKLNGTTYASESIRTDWGNKIGIQFSPYGWNTGHYLRIDDLSIQSQNTAFP